MLPKIALLSTWQQFYLAAHNLFQIPGSHLENSGHILIFQSGSLAKFECYVTRNHHAKNGTFHLPANNFILLLT